MCLSYPLKKRSLHRSANHVVDALCTSEYNLHMHLLLLQVAMMAPRRRGNVTLLAVRPNKL
jgi:hypothetical protein